ncbi:MAG: hypothetical protein CL510_10190 [Actinobacteria bacterium]|jgi:hypothetical protein|nr:hypothetical protein [Actinomycetota bacterium]|tara:strand:+ start:7500 stop:7760 length:261 start_codon:yes stop_codon:yes gene_type:complete
MSGLKARLPGGLSLPVAEVPKLPRGYTVMTNGYGDKRLVTLTGSIVLRLDMDGTPDGFYYARLATDSKEELEQHIAAIAAFLQGAR